MSLALFQGITARKQDTINLLSSATGTLKSRFTREKVAVTTLGSLFDKMIAALME